MRIGFLIGALSAGGSERQLSELSVGLSSMGHNVSIAAYDGPGVFDDYVESNGVELIKMDGGSKLDKLKNIRQWVRSFQPEVMHGFMKRASSLAILSNLPKRSIPVVASDFSTATYAAYKPSLWLSLLLFGFADAVVTQTNMNRDSLQRLAPFLKNKLHIVRNGVNLDRFNQDDSQTRGTLFKFLCVGSVYGVKNPVNMTKAVKLLRDEVGDIKPGMSPMRLATAM